MSILKITGAAALALAVSFAGPALADVGFTNSVILVDGEAVTPDSNHTFRVRLDRHGEAEYEVSRGDRMITQTVACGAPGDNHAWIWVRVDDDGAYWVECY